MYSTPQGYGPGHFARPDVRADLVGDTEPRPVRYLVSMALGFTYARGHAERAFAKWFQQCAPDLDGTIIEGTGFGGWGVEHGLTIITTTARRDLIRWAVLELLRLEDQQCAYVERQAIGSPTLHAEEWAADGSVTPIAGTWSGEARPVDE